MKKTLLIFWILTNMNLFGQSNSKQFEFSTFAGTALSFSKLTESHTKEYSSPPSFGIMYGIKLEKKIFNRSKGISINTSYVSQELSISSKFYFKEKKRAMGHSSTSLPVYDIWSLGLRKSFKLSPLFNFEIEIGEKTHFARSYKSNPKYLVSDYLDSIVTYNFKYATKRDATVIPYFGIGWSIKYKKIKIEAFFWTQRSFVPILRYSTYTSYGSKYFISDVVSYGFAIGGQLGMKVVSF